MQPFACKYKLRATGWRLLNGDASKLCSTLASETSYARQWGPVSEGGRRGRKGEQRDVNDSRGRRVLSQVPPHHHSCSRSWNWWGHCLAVFWHRKLQAVLIFIAMHDICGTSLSVPSWIVFCGGCRSSMFIVLPACQWRIQGSSMGSMEPPFHKKTLLIMQLGTYWAIIAELLELTYKLHLELAVQSMKVPREPIMISEINMKAKKFFSMLRSDRSALRTSMQRDTLVPLTTGPWEETYQCSAQFQLNPLFKILYRNVECAPV